MHSMCTCICFDCDKLWFSAPNVLSPLREEFSFGGIAHLPCKVSLGRTAKYILVMLQPQNAFHYVTSRILS